MPWGVAAGVAASVAGSAISGAISPSSSGGTGGSGGYYVPTGLQPADQQWQAIQNQNYNKYMGYDLDQYGLNSLQMGINNAQAYGGGYQNAANAAGQYYGQLGSQLQGASGNLFNAGNQVYQSAFDPQNALYNRTVQQLQDQTGATNSMYGLGSSGAGAGVANQALGNFNIDWQNQQLQRQIQGLGALGQGYGQAGALGQMGAGSTLMSGQLPYETGQTLAAAPGQIAGQFGQFLNQNVYGPGQAIQGQYIPYANNGQGAQAVPYQAQAQGAGAAGALGGQAIGQGISGIGNAYQNAGSWGNLFGGTTGSYGGGDFSGAFTSNPYYSGGGNSYGFTM
jgi:hypothetical protein